jgi:hypothetical protein
MGATLGEFGQTLNQGLRQATDVRGWIGKHPWLALGVAAAAGFAGGMALAPGSRRSEPVARSDFDRRESFAADEPPPRSRLASLASMIPWDMLMGPITELVRTLVENLFAAVVASRAAAQANAAAQPASTASASNDKRRGPSSAEFDSPLDDPMVEQATEA